MGVKSTQDLTHDEAIEKYIDFRMRQYDVRQRFEREAKAMSHTELADWLMRENDRVHDGEGYRSYFIV